MEKVSVIVPVYNGEKSIKRCSDSILNQDYPELELILVDDGSRDCSWEIMQALAAADHRVKAIHQENGGVSSARNRALAEASGTFVQFADVDDWLPMDATKLLVREMEAQSSELVVGDFYRVVDGNVSEKGSIASGGTLTLQQYADEMMLSPADLYYGVLWNKLYRRDIIERYGIRMDENISYSEDMIFNLEYLLHVKNIAILKAPVYYYQYTKGSLVDQSLNLSSTIKMKKNVIGYYNEFFKKTFDAPAYQERLPVIYGYLLAVSHDSLALPFTPGTRKLTAGSDLSALSGESGTAFPMRSAILETRLLGRYLETLGRKHGMDEAYGKTCCDRGNGPTPGGRTGEARGPSRRRRTLLFPGAGAHRGTAAAGLGCGRSVFCRIYRRRAPAVPRVGGADRQPDSPPSAGRDSKRIVSLALSVQHLEAPFIIFRRNPVCRK